MKRLQALVDTKWIYKRLLPETYFQQKTFSTTFSLQVPVVKFISIFLLAPPPPPLHLEEYYFFQNLYVRNVQFPK